MTKHKLHADKVIKEFGGVRPLATRLDITASTVQGWKKRGVIPDPRIKSILEAANEDGISLEKIILSAPTPEPIPGSSRFYPLTEERRERLERRQGQDRRKGQDSKYKGEDRRQGPDQRKGLDRRSFEQRQKDIVRKEKRAFIEKAAISLAFLFILGVLGLGFIMAPEYVAMKEKSARIEKLENEVKIMEEHLKILRSQEQKAQNRESRINFNTDDLKKYTDELLLQIDDAAESALNVLKSENIPAQLNAMQGQEDLRIQIAALENELSQMKENLDKTQSQTREALALLEKASHQDISSATMIIALGQLSNTLERNKVPFEQDLASLRKAANQQPKIVENLDLLSPYAESGVLSPEHLREEFLALSTKVIQSQLNSESLSLQERAKLHLGSLIKIRKAGEYTGTSTDIAVNKASDLLDNGDIKGAILVLEGLQDPAAGTMKPWIDQAQGRVLVDTVSKELNNNILTTISQNKALPPVTTIKEENTLETDIDLEVAPEVETIVEPTPDKIIKIYHEPEASNEPPIKDTLPDDVASDIEPSLIEPLIEVEKEKE